MHKKEAKANTTKQIRTYEKLGEGWRPGEDESANQSLSERAKERKLRSQPRAEGETSAHGSPGSEGFYRHPPGLACELRKRCNGSLNHRVILNFEKQLHTVPKK